MEKIRETALAYYAILPAKEKKKAVFVQKNGLEWWWESNYKWVWGQFQEASLVMLFFLVLSLFNEIFQERRKSFFEELDKDGDGTLDFEEFITLYYLLRTGRLLFCNGHECQVFLNGLFFFSVVPDALKTPTKKKDFHSLLNLL